MIILILKVILFFFIYFFVDVIYCFEVGGFMLLDILENLMQIIGIYKVYVVFMDFYWWDLFYIVEWVFFNFLCFFKYFLFQEYLDFVNYYVGEIVDLRIWWGEVFVYFELLEFMEKGNIIKMFKLFYYFWYDCINMEFVEVCM